MKAKSDKAFNLRIPKDLYKEFQEKCELDGISVANAIKQFMRSDDAKSEWHHTDRCLPNGYFSLPADGLLVLVATKIEGRTIPPIIPSRSMVSIAFRSNATWLNQSNQPVYNVYAWHTLPQVPPLPPETPLPWPYGPAVTEGEKIAQEYVASSGRAPELAKAIDEMIKRMTGCKEHKWHKITEADKVNIPQGVYLSFTNCIDPNEATKNGEKFLVDSPCNISGNTIYVHSSQIRGSCNPVDLYATDFPYTYWCEGAPN